MSSSYSNSTKGYFNSFGPYSAEVYYLLDEDMQPMLDDRNKKIRVRISTKEMAEGVVAIQFIRNGYFGGSGREYLVKE